MRNSGKTPAQEVCFDVAVAWAHRGSFDPEAHSKQPNNFDRIDAGAVVAPADEHHFGIGNPYRLIKKNWPPAADDNAGELYLIMRFAYGDVGKGKYRTERCYIWDAQTQAFLIDPRGDKMY